MPTTEVVAPWPGRIAEIHVELGAAVVAGQELLTIESMKILHPVPSEHAGRVAAILVQVNSVVQEGDPLLRIDA